MRKKTRRSLLAFALADAILLLLWWAARETESGQRLVQNVLTLLRP